MKQNELPNDGYERDANLAAALQTLPVPAASGNLQQRTRGRIRAKVFQRQAIVGLRAAVVLLVIALLFQVWIKSASQLAPATELSAAELDFLFAPPPIDPLAVLDQQQQVAYRTLQRWESNR
jgi:hypothetical protein